jgi:hypothetical protein
MEKIIRLMNIAKLNDIVVLDTIRGQFSAARDSSQTIQGNYLAVGDQEMGIFAVGKNLYFQWNKARWNFKDLALAARYQHDFPKKVTVFLLEMWRLNIRRGGPAIRLSTQAYRSAMKTKIFMRMSRAWLMTGRCGRR